jgi:hypothetical protein
MNKLVVTSQELIDDASAYFINLKNTGAWKIEMSRNSQIIALTTQLTELKAEMGKLSASKGTPKLDHGNPLVVLPSMSSNFGVSRRLTTKLSTAWLNVTERPGIGVISTGTITKVSLRMACTSLTSLTDTMLGWREETKAGKVVQRLRPEMTLLASPPQPLLCLTTLLLQSSLFQSRFRLHW